MPSRLRGISRRQIIAVFFALLGCIIMTSNVGVLGATPTIYTRLAFGVGPGTPVWTIPTASTLLVIGGIYLLSGALGLFAQTARIGVPLLWICAGLMFPTIMVGAAVGKQTNVLTMIAETLRLGTPLALGALSGIYAERSGVVNIAIEGMMLLGAAFGFAAFVATGNIWLGVGAALTIGALSALLHGLISLTFKTDQIVSGTVINILAIGVTGYLRRSFMVGASGGRVTLPEMPIPLLKDIPYLGDMLFREKPIFYAMIVLVVASHFILFYTPWGLRMRAVGENPRAADTVGINVNRTRYLNLLISGLIAGLAGAWFSLETVGNFDDGMTAGKGFIALAAMIFGKWTPFGAFGGAMLFGFTDALGIRFQLLKVEFFGHPLPVQFLQILPYVVTMVVLAGLIGRAVAPAAVGKPYEK